MSYRTGLLAGLLLMISPMVSVNAETETQSPGTLYDVYDMRLHVLCSGPVDAPSVILESGLAGSFLDWTWVQKELARTLRVCSYDRAGAGYSSRTARPRDAGNITAELFQLVRVARIRRPFILVGASFGGLLGLFYARQFPHDVAGLVLVDAMVPTQFGRFAAAGVELDLDPHRVLGGTSPVAAAYRQPESQRRLAIDLAAADKARVFIVREMTHMVDSADQVAAAGLPHLPSYVLVHGNHEWDSPYPDGRMEKTWADMQNDLAATIGAPRPIVIAGSGHQIELDAPGAVTCAVNALAGRVDTSPQGAVDASSEDHSCLGAQATWYSPLGR